MVEYPNRKAWVLASPEILDELLKDWSRPVQAHATENPDGSWDMTFRTYNQPERIVSTAKELADIIERYRPLDGPWPPSAYLAIHEAHDKLLAALKAGENA